MCIRDRLVPDLMKLMDEKKLGFTTAVELSYIGKKNQNYIAVAIDSQQSSPYSEGPLCRLPPKQRLGNIY